ncbi:MAG TPA: hypothetical protein VMU87_22750 [Stellaceae bacterium]|nr:hypothetical protein [Stellaceae bacterium]
MMRWTVRRALAPLAALAALAAFATPAWAAWQPLVDDTFTNANTSTGAAGTTTGVPTQGGWTDVHGGVWNIQSDNAVGAPEGTNSWSRDFLTRPSAENQLDERIVVKLGTAAGTAGETPWPVLRYQSSGKAYTVDTAPGNFQVYYLAGGGSATAIGPTHNWTYTSGHVITVDFSVTGASPSTLTVVVTDVTAATTLVNYTTTDSTAGVQGAGNYGLDLDGTAVGNQSAAEATTYSDASFTVSPTSVTVSTTGNSLTLAGTGTNWTAGTPGAPTFTVSGGTITAQSVSSTTAATLTYSAPGSAGTVTITDPSTAATATLTIAAAGATDFSFTPSSQTTPDGTATGNFTITPNATPSSSTTVSFSDGGAGGTFTPSSLTFTTSTAQTFTYTPAGAAVTPITLTATASGGFTASHTATVDTTSTIAVNDANWFWSPYTWYVNGSTSALSQDWGAYFKIGFTGTQVQATFDVSALTGASTASADYPYVRWSIDNGVYHTYQLTAATTTYTLASGLAAGTHQLWLAYYGATFNGDFWTTPVKAVKIDGLVVDGGSASAAPSLRPKRCLFYGDSITQGHYSPGPGATPFADGTLAYSAFTASGLGCEYGNIGYGSTGYTVGDLNVRQSSRRATTRILPGTSISPGPRGWSRARSRRRRTTSSSTRAPTTAARPTRRSRPRRRACSRRCARRRRARGSSPRCRSTARNAPRSPRATRPTRRRPMPRPN